MNTYPEMNENIVTILRWTDNPVSLYAAVRIEELEAKQERLVKACKAYLRDHDDDVARLCRYAGIQTSACGCDLCKQARAALKPIMEEGTDG